MRGLQSESLHVDICAHASDKSDGEDQKRQQERLKTHGYLWKQSNRITHMRAHWNHAYVYALCAYEILA